MEELQTLVFKIGEEFYGINIITVRGIENVKGFTRVPNTANYIKGIINLRGDIIPVYSLRKKFGMEEKTGDEMNLVVLNLGDMLMAVEIDNIEMIQNVEKDMIHEIPPIVRNGNEKYYDKVISVDGKIIVVIDPNKLLSQEEKEAINGILAEN